MEVSKTSWTRHSQRWLLGFHGRSTQDWKLGLGSRVSVTFTEVMGAIYGVASRYTGLRDHVSYSLKTL